MMTTRRFSLISPLLMLLCVPAAHADRPSPTRASASADDALLRNGPLRPTMAQLVHHLDRTSPVRFSMRAGPLRAQALDKLTLALLPPDTRASYEAFLAKTKFDPMAQAEGVLLVADAADFSSLDSARDVLMVMPFHGNVYNGLIDYLVDFQSEKENENESSRNLSIALLATVTPRQVRRLADDMVKDNRKEGNPVRRVDIDGQHILVSLVDKRRKELDCSYIWPGGMLLGTVPNPSLVLDERKSQALCTNVLRKLDAAGRAKTPTTLPVMTLTTPIPGGTVQLTVTQTRQTTITTTLQMDRAMVPKFQEVANNWKLIQSQPAAFLNAMKLPGPIFDLGKLLVENTKMSMSGDTGIVSTQVSTTELGQKIAQALEQLGQ